MPLLSGMMLSAHLLIVKLIHASLLLCLLLFCELVILFRLLHLTHRFWLQLKQRHRQRKRQMHDSVCVTCKPTWLLVYTEKIQLLASLQACYTEYRKEDAPQLNMTVKSKLYIIQLFWYIQNRASKSFMNLDIYP